MYVDCGSASDCVANLIPRTALRTVAFVLAAAATALPARQAGRAHSRAALRTAGQSSAASSPTPDSPTRTDPAAARDSRRRTLPEPAPGPEPGPDR